VAGRGHVAQRRHLAAAHARVTQRPVQLPATSPWAEPGLSPLPQCATRRKGCQAHVTHWLVRLPVQLPVQLPATSSWAELEPPFSPQCATCHRGCQARSRPRRWASAVWRACGRLRSPQARCRRERTGAAQQASARLFRRSAARPPHARAYLRLCRAPRCGGRRPVRGQDAAGRARPRRAHRVAQARGAPQCVDERVVRAALQRLPGGARVRVHAPRGGQVARVDAGERQRGARLLPALPRVRANTGSFGTAHHGHRARRRPYLGSG
jgi:hypothetical protein